MIERIAGRTDFVYQILDEYDGDKDIDKLLADSEMHVLTGKYLFYHDPCIFYRIHAEENPQECDEEKVRTILANRMLLFFMEKYLGLRVEDSMSVEESLDSFFFCKPSIFSMTWNSPCSSPHTIKVQLAPCQIPLTANVMRILA